MRLFLALLLMVIVTGSAQAETFRGFTKMTKPVDASLVRVTDPHSMPVTLSAWRGSWILLNVWATWCAPCVVELPSLQTFQATQPFTDLVVLGVSTDVGKDTAGVIDFLKGHGIDLFAAYTDGDLALSETLSPTGLPTTYLINPNGMAVAQYRGAADWASPDVVQDLKRLMSSGKIKNTSPTSP